MDKILIYGTGKAYFSYQPLFQKYAQKGLLQISAIVSPPGTNIEAGDQYPVIHPEDIVGFPFDKIIIGVNLSEFEAAKQLLTGLGIDSGKFMGLSQYFLTLEMKTEYYEPIINRQLVTIQKILSASDEEVRNYQWMYRTIGEFGLYPFDTRNRPDILWSEWGIMQILEEFIPFCNMIGCMEDIQSAIEIGVFKGRSSYFMCALLSRKNPGLKYTLVDICDHLDSFERYRELLPALDKQIPSTSGNYRAQAYDFVFIDADHSYDASMQDYLLLGQYAKKITVFHDIYGHEYDHQNGGSVRTWKEVLELTKEKEHKIFTEFPDQWMGIGCVLHQSSLPSA